MHAEDCERHDTAEATDTHMELERRIRQAIGEKAVHNYGALRRGVTDASRLGDMTDSKAITLLQLLDVFAAKNPEERRKLLLERAPDLLSEDERARAGMEHDFRVANGREHACSHLQWNARQQCADCLKPTQAGCTEHCPARDGGQVLVASQEPETVLA